MATAAVPLERIEQRIYLIRGEKVMLDADIATLYETPTRVLNQAVRRNPDRFPADFMFQLTPEEAGNLRSQFVISSSHGGRRTLPFAFTEHGVAMLSSVLSSSRAVQMNILIVRAFLKLRETLAMHKDLAWKLDQLERQQTQHGHQLASVYSIVKALIEPAPRPKRQIGF